MIDRQTDHTILQTPAFKVDNGLDQGDPLSSIAYLIYNADLPKIAEIKLNFTLPHLVRTESELSARNAWTSLD